MGKYEVIDKKASYLWIVTPSKCCFTSRWILNDIVIHVENNLSRQAQCHVFLAPIRDKSLSLFFIFQFPLDYILIINTYPQFNLLSKKNCLKSDTYNMLLLIITWTFGAWLDSGNYWFMFAYFKYTFY